MSIDTQCANLGRKLHSKVCLVQDLPNLAKRVAVSSVAGSPELVRRTLAVQVGFACCVALFSAESCSCISSSRVPNLAKRVAVSTVAGSPELVRRRLAVQVGFACCVALFLHKAAAASHLRECML